MTKPKLIDGMRDSLWMTTACDAPATKSLSGVLKCEVVIIGGGFTGLNAALELALQGTSVIVLEAGVLGTGSSGRSGGQVNIGLNLGPSDLLEKFGSAKGERMLDAVTSAPDHLFELIRTQQLDCDPVQNGWVQAAISRSILNEQRTLAEQYREFGVEMEMLDADALSKKTGTHSYVGGMFYAGAGSIQPLSYTRSLARAVIDKGGQVFTQSPVSRLQTKAGGWQVHTDSAQVDCEEVLVCTNAYGDQLVDQLDKKIVPVRSILVATEPLSQELRNSILPDQVTFVDKRKLILYMRYDRDGRLCVGDHGPSRDWFKLKDFNLVKRRAASVFPALENVRWDFHWGGRVAMTKDGLPFVHQIAPGLTAGMGYNGRGVAMGSMMGKILAKKLLSANSADSAFPITRPDTFKMHAFHKIGVVATVSWYELQDYLQRLS